VAQPSVNTNVNLYGKIDGCDHDDELLLAFNGYLSDSFGYISCMFVFLKYTFL